MGVWQPGMQRRQADLGAIAQEQEHEGGIEQARIKMGGMRHKGRPSHTRKAFAHHRLGRHIDQDGTKQRKRNADAGENEIFPGCF